MAELFNFKLFRVDWVTFGIALLLSALGLVTMASFTPDDPFATRQFLWISFGVVAFFAASMVDWRLLRRSAVAGGIYFALLAPLLLLVVAGSVFQGARSWFDLGFFAFQPVEFIKIGLIIVLAKYFSRRHIEIRNIRHILVSGAYAFVVFALVALQPDFGSAIIIFCIWLGLVLVSGISRWHLFLVFALGFLAFAALWFFGFEDYQKERIMTFVHPLADIQGAGYNAYQSMVAVGSGELLGKGIGYGTQSKLRFLPEYQTDFIFAAFAEEWGLVGVGLLFCLYGILLFRIIYYAPHGATNFETLFAFGIFFYFFAHVALHAGINLGLLPVTGTTIPFMSYGGSHLLTEFLALGMLSGQRAYSRVTPRDALRKEFSGGYDVVS